MILSSLNDLYHRLLANPDPASGLARVPPFGFTDENISFSLVLSSAGQLVDVVDLRQIQEKKSVAKRLSVPRPEKRTSGLKSNFLWDKTAYVLGVEGNKDKKSTKETPWLIAEKTHEAFKKFHQKKLNGQSDAGLQALCAFLKNWQPEQFKQAPFTLDMVDANVVFKLDGELGYIHERTAAQSLWLSLLQPDEGTDTSAGMCLVTGEQATLSRLHPAIKGVYGGQSSGGSIVSFNAEAYESYGKSQGDNAPVSESAAFAYTTALNYLLRRENGHCISIGDTSTVFWAQAREAKQEQLAVSLFGAIFNPQPTDESQTLKLGFSLEKISKGRPLAEIAPELDLDTRFYVLGLAPNAARLSIRYWFDTQLRILETNLQKHRQALLIDPLPWHEDKPPGVWRFMLELTPCRWKTDGTREKRKPEDIPPQLAGEFFRSVIAGAHYPSSLLSKLIQRMRSDGDISGLRVAMVKAVLYRNFERSVPMGLNEDEESIAYQLGCQFALCELAQRAAIGKVNSGVKDKFFGSASATPKTVFSSLYRNFNHHVSALRKGKKADDWPGEPKKLAGWLETRTGKILWHIEANKGFPYQMSLADQGMFVLGYYHQKFHRPKDPTISVVESDNTNSEDDQGDQS